MDMLSRVNSDKNTRLDVSYWRDIVMGAKRIEQTIRSVTFQNETVQSATMQTETTWATWETARSIIISQNCVYVALWNALYRTHFTR